MKTGRQILAVLIYFCIIVFLLPVNVSAASSKAIQIGADGISKGDFIYFGNYNNEKVKWKVISEEGNGGTYQESGKPLFLLSEYLLDYEENSDNVPFDKDRIANEGQENPNEWQKSDAQIWCTEFAEQSFTPEENAAIHITSKDEIEAEAYNMTFKSGNLIKEQVFFISADETASYISDQDGDSGLAGATSSGNTPGWWLRSRDPERGEKAVCSIWGGTILFNGVNISLSARPAFNLNSDFVLFRSAASSGKKLSDTLSGDTASVLSEIGDYTGNEWKVTLLDKKRSFAISSAKVTDNVVTFSYSNARTGLNEYISAVIIDNNEITHYGRVLQLDGNINGTNGTGVTIKIPDGVTLNENTALYVFNEQYNGEEEDMTQLTDYASTLCNVTDAIDSTAPILTSGEVSRDSDADALVTFTSSEAGEYYYIVQDRGGIEPEIDTTGTGMACGTDVQTITLANLTAGVKEIYILVKDAAGNVSEKLKMEIPAYQDQPGSEKPGGDGTIYYALLFETNEGSKINAIVREAGNTIDLSEYRPVREGYEFSGWYADEMLTEPVTEVLLNTTKTIYAGWTEQDARKEQKIFMTVPAQERDLKNGSRTTNSRLCTLKLGFAVEDEDMELIYETSNPNIATVEGGKITYQGVGTCIITVTAKATDTCRETSLPITVKVGKLGTPTFTPTVSSKTAEKAFTVTSSTVRGVEGWEVQYSIRPDFWRATTKDFPDIGTKLYRKNCTTVHSNMTYYIHVRGYQIVDGKKVYSDWSPMKTIKTK